MHEFESSHLSFQAQQPAILTQCTSAECAAPWVKPDKFEALLAWQELGFTPCLDKPALLP